MQKDKYEYLQNLLRAAFVASCEVLERDLQKAEPKATARQIQAEIQKEYPLVELLTKPAEINAVFGIMAAQGVFSPEDGIDDTEFFSGMLHMIRGSDRQRANECAGRTLLILSENYRQMIGTPADVPTLN
jgi:hypothetical protein